MSNRTPSAVVAVAAAAVAVYAAWLGRAHVYTPGQVAGCGVSLLVLLVVALLLRVPPLAAAGAVTVGFTAAWTAHAAAYDSTGLYLVGAVMVFAGLAAGSALTVAVVAGLRRVVPGRR